MGHVVEKDRGRYAIAGTPIVIPLQVVGTLAEGNGKAYFTNAVFPIRVKAIIGALGTLHTTSTGGVGEVIQIRNVTDTLDLMDTPNRMAFTDTWTINTIIGDSILQNQNVDIDDVLAVDVDDVDTGTGAADLMIHLIAERRVT